MHLHSLPGAWTALLISSWLFAINAQFGYPPPLDRPLTDYTSGKATSGLNFSEGDNMFGGWTTPGRLMSFMLYRCTHTPSSKPIRPSNSSFASREGRVAADGTWEQMPLHEGFDNAFGSGFNSGKNPIWFHGDFFAPNKTTGDLCWFELYPGSETVTYDVDGQQRVATVDGTGPWYFATVPFTVNPRRPSGLTVTWKNDGTERGKPTRNIMSNASDSASVSHDFPDMASEADSNPDSSGLSLGIDLTTCSIILMLLHCFMAI